MTPRFRLYPFVPLFFLALGPAAAAETHCTSLDIHRIGAEQLHRLESHPGPERWAEVDRVLFVCGSNAVLDELASISGRPAGPRWAGLDSEMLFLVRAPHPWRLAEASGVDVLARSGPWVAAAARDAATARELASGHWPVADGQRSGEPAPEHEGCQRPAVLPFEGRQVLARQTANGPLPGGSLGGSPFPP